MESCLVVESPSMVQKSNRRLSRSAPHWDNLSKVQRVQWATIAVSSSVKDSPQFKIPEMSPPEWDTSDLKNRVPSKVLFRSTATPAKLLGEIHAFFHEGAVPAEVSEPLADKPWTVRAAAFVDNVEVDLEIHVFTLHDAPLSSMVAFEHMTQNDIVRFHHIAANFCKHAERKGLVISNQSASVALPVGCCRGDDSDDIEFETEDEAALWQKRVDNVFILLESSVFAIRLEAVQLLAQWTETKPACRFPVAEALHSRPKLLTCFSEKGNTAPLCELYLMAVALRFITTCPEAAKLLQEPLLPVLAEAANQSLPKLVLTQIAFTLAAL